MVPKTCSIAECGTAGKITRGWCIKHYNRWLKHGSTDDPRKTPEERFWEKVNKTDTCWLWMAGKSDTGYGSFGLGKHVKHAHRVSYEWANGPIPQGAEVDHRCHVLQCVNPLHLRLATKKQNQENLTGANSRSKSGIRGVWLDPARNRWAAQVGHGGKRHSLGYFDNVAEAEAAVVAKRNELFTHNDVDRIAA